MKINKVILVTVAALMCSVGARAQEDAVTEVNKKFNEAAAAMQAKNYAAAITALEKTVDMGLDVPDAIETVQRAQKYLPVCYYQQGLWLVKSNKLDEALIQLNTADELAQLYSDASTSRKSKSLISKIYTVMGGDAFNSKDYAKAAEIFSKGYAANPQDTDLALNLGMSYCELGDFENGTKVYTEVIALGNVHSKFIEPAAKAKESLKAYLLQKAVAEFKADNIDGGYATLDTIISIDPVDPSAHMLRLQTATSSKQWDKIIEWGDAAIAAQADPKLQGDATYLLAVAYDSKDQNDIAIETYRKVTAGNYVDAAKKRIPELEALKK